MNNGFSFWLGRLDVPYALGALIGSFLWGLLLGLARPDRERRRSGLAAACRAMWRLNRAIPDLPRRDKRRAYALKNRLIRWLYCHGYCTEARRQDQIKKCWHTRAYKYGWEDYCEKCGNTGIYSRYPLWRLTFQVGNQYFIWHQPAEYVDWPIEETAERMDDWSGRAEAHSYDRSSDLVRDAWIVWRFLLLHGALTWPPTELAWNFSPALFIPFVKRVVDPCFYRHSTTVYVPPVLVRWNARTEPHHEPQWNVAFPLFWLYPDGYTRKYVEQLGIEFGQGDGRTKIVFWFRRRPHSISWPSILIPRLLKPCQPAAPEVLVEDHEIPF